jgi:hypothetical protein
MGVTSRDTPPSTLLSHVAGSPVLRPYSSLEPMCPIGKFPKVTSFSHLKISKTGYWKIEFHPNSLRSFTCKVLSARQCYIIVLYAFECRLSMNLQLQWVATNLPSLLLILLWQSRDSSNISVSYFCVHMLCSFKFRILKNKINGSVQGDNE